MNRPWLRANRRKKQRRRPNWQEEGKPKSSASARVAIVATLARVVIFLVRCLAIVVTKAREAIFLVRCLAIVVLNLRDRWGQ